MSGQEVSERKKSGQVRSGQRTYEGEYLEVGAQAEGRHGFEWVGLGAQHVHILLEDETHRGQLQYIHC
jgi:hypothetical protein